MRIDEINSEIVLGLDGFAQIFFITFIDESAKNSFQRRDRKDRRDEV